MVEFGLEGAHRQKSERESQSSGGNDYRRGRTIYVVDKRRLTHGILILCGRVADIVPCLGTADGGGVVVDLIRLMEEGGEEGDEGGM